MSDPGVCVCVCVCLFVFAAPSPEHKHYTIDAVSIGARLPHVQQFMVIARTVAVNCSTLRSEIMKIAPSRAKA
jgi:hypothetical protein